MTVISTIRIRLAFAVVVVAILFAGAFWYRPAFPKKITLKDGSEFRVLDLIFTNSYFYPKPTFLQKLAMKFPPPFQRTNGKVWSANFQLGNPVYTIAYEHAVPQRKGLEFRIEDDNGWSSVENLYPPSERPAFGPIDFMDFDTFPNRSKYVKLIISSDKSVPLGEIKFKNPFYSTAQKWSTLPLPQHQTVGNFDFTLTEAESLPPEKHAIKANLTLRTRWTHLRLEIKSKNDPIQSAGVIAVDSGDATGNFSKKYDIWAPDSDSVIDIWFQDSIRPAEPIRFDIRMFITTAAFTNSVFKTVSFLVQPRVVN